MKAAASSTVTGPVVPEIPARPSPPGIGRSGTNVASTPETPEISCRVRYWVRSTTVRAQVAQRTRACVLPLQPPGQREGRVGQPVLQVAGPDVPDLADPAAGDELAGQREGRDAAVVETHHGADPPGLGPGGRRRHGLGLGHRVGQRLLAQHVLARLQRGDGNLGVRVAGRAHVDQLHVVAFEQGAPVGFHPAEPVALRRHLRRRAVPAAQCGQHRTHRQVEGVRGGPPGLGVRRAHERVADHADAE